MAITVPSDSGYDQTIDYEFNAASQITSKVMQNELYLPTDYGGSSVYSVNGLNQITDEISDGSTLIIDYDKNGNLTDDGVTTFGYDLFNRLTSVSGGTLFDYDATGRLYSIASSSTNTYFLYDGQALIGEYTVDGSGNVSLQHRYAHGLDVDTPIVWYEGSAVSNTTRKYLVRDELGSVVLVTDNNGDADHHNVYDEFGVPGTPGTSNVGRFQYTGQTWLDEAGLYYYKARVYNPYLGRFHQTDPIGYGDGLNMYAYVRNDPTNNTDPTGMAADDNEAPECERSHEFCGTREGKHDDDWYTQELVIEEDGTNTLTNIIVTASKKDVQRKRESREYQLWLEATARSNAYRYRDRTLERTAIATIAVQIAAPVAIDLLGQIALPSIAGTTGGEVCLLGASLCIVTAAPTLGGTTEIVSKPAIGVVNNMMRKAAARRAADKLAAEAVRRHGGQ